jgi:hypothetical protein
MTRQNGGITRSTNNKATVRRLRDKMIFWKAMAQIHNEAVVASVGSYLLDIIANKD